MSPSRTDENELERREPLDPSEEEHVDPEAKRYGEDRRGFFQKHPAAKPIVFLIAIVVVVLVGWFWWESRHWESTDDAEIDGHIYPVSARVGGQVTKVNYDAGMVVVNSALYFNPPYFNIRVFFPSQAGLLTLANPFPLNLSYVPPPSLSTLSPNLTTANIQAWNYTIQRELPSAGTLTVSYAGSKGTHLIYSRNIDQPPPGPGDPSTRVPNPAFGGIDYIDSGANSSFNSLQVTFNRALRRDLSVLAAYTFSKSIDDTSAFEPVGTDQNFPQNSYNYRAEIG